MTLPDLSAEPHVLAAVRAALAEDIGAGDATTEALVDAGTAVRAELLTREPCTVSGTAVAALAFRETDPLASVETLKHDGVQADAGDVLLRVTGPARGILTAERTALNFMQRMCGVATQTHRFVQRVATHGTVILDTRKTTPGLRALEKYAVRCGGGMNHRFGLYDRILIKDNHRRLWRSGAPDDLADAVRKARARFPKLQVEIEVESILELRNALQAHPDWVLLDNMTPAIMREAVALCRGISLTEASGGIGLDTVEEVAMTGVDAISLGCLTHSVRSIDLSLEIAEYGLHRH